MTVEGHLGPLDVTIDPGYTRAKLNEEVDLSLRPERMSIAEYKLRRKVELIIRTIFKKKATS